ncbi:DUF7319 domain-containing protein [Halorubrum vacuolatum]|uniref:DUF7319 domain-containing protein n=1 Tax=Halorubrum vacuolatum TaxID=63740 RepID=A0A238XV30_HALVU|nr:hypothetical protein [Halorubrum vacuolatum]SNR62381.1 hypothetical protein SAMN06264855_12326 [Halorubrum vacuolatum]
MDDSSTRSSPDGAERRDGNDAGDNVADEHDESDDVADAHDAGDGVADKNDAGDDVADGTTGVNADIDELRQRVETEYDFEDFGPDDMARMSAEEWDVAFDPETWIVGDELLDRAEDELKSRIARREVFGILERVEEDGVEQLLVYSDEGYAIITPDGEVTGRGTVMRDVEPVVALAAMEEYEVPEPPDDWSLPDPETVPQGSGEFGNLMIQIVAALQVIAGVALLGAWIVLDVDTIVAPAVGILFLLIGVFLFAMVANARLSDRFRAEEYRGRLRALREAEERPEFVPLDSPAKSDENDDR